MNTSVLIGLRFMRSKTTTGFLSLVTRVSVFGLMLGVMALVIVISVMNGFDSQLKYRILGAAPHAILSEMPERSEGIRHIAPFLRSQGMLLGNDNRMVSIHGVKPELENNMSVLNQHMVDGAVSDISPGNNQIILGASIAARMGLWLGDSITLMIPVASVGGQSVLPSVAKVEVVGIFRLDSELDFSLIVMHVEDLQALVGAPQTNYRVTLDDIFLLSKIQEQYSASLLATWADDYGDFFSAVRMEKLMMFLLLTMIVMIAAFNTVSGLSMMVKEKQAEIAVLRTMGLTPGDITSVFVIQGSVVGVSGVLLGLILGLPAAYFVSEIVGFVEDLFGGRMLAGTYFDRVPSEIRAVDIFMIALVSTMIANAATIYPAYRAGQLQPAEILRAE